MVKLGLAVVAALALAAPDADAGGRGRGGSGSHARSGGHHHSHVRGTAVVGGGFYYGYPAYYYGYPPYYDVPLYPPAPADPYWYYCRAAGAYYPYVQACPGGWERYLAGSPSG